jgi:hypothetical protein
MVNFLYNVYLDTKRQIPFHLLDIFLNIQKSLVDEFEFYSKKKYLSAEDSIEMNENFFIACHHSYKHFRVWLADYLILIIKCFSNLFKRNLNLIPESEPLWEYEKILTSIIDLAQISIEKLQNEEVTNAVISLIRELHSKYPSGPITEKIKEKHRAYVDPKFKNKSKDRNSKGITRKPTGRICNSAQGKITPFKRYERLIDIFYHSESLWIKVQREFVQVVDFLKFLDTKLTMDQLAEPQHALNLFSINQSLIKYVMRPNSGLEEECLICCLRLFRLFIESNQQTEKIESLIDLEMEEWMVIKANVRNSQELLIDQDIISMLGEILKQENSLKVDTEVLLLAIGLIYGGFEKAQENFFKMISEDREGLILKKIEGLIKDSSKVIKESMSELNALSLKKFYAQNESEGFNKRASLKTAEKQYFVKREIDQVAEKYMVCRLAFKFLQLLCEGHQMHIQNLLRDQTEESSRPSYRNINFISLSASIWGSLIKIINPACTDLGIKVQEFIIESIQGPCELNQLEYYNNKIIDYSKDFIIDFLSPRDYQIRGFTERTNSTLDQLIAKTIKMLNSLLESNQNAEIYNYLGKNLGFALIIEQLTKQFEAIFEGLHLRDKHATFTPESLAKLAGVKNYDLRFSDCFETFFFIQYIDDFTGAYSRQIQALEGVQALAYRYCRQTSASIEVTMNGKIQKFFFMVHPLCTNIDRNDQENFLLNANRETPQAKILDLIKFAPQMFDKMYHMHRLSGAFKLLNQNTMNNARTLSFLLVAAINLYVVLTHSKQVVNFKYVVVSNAFTPVFLQIAGVLHILVWLLILLLWAVLEAKLTVVEAWRAKFLTYQKLLKSYTHLSKSCMKVLTVALEFRRITIIINKNMFDLSRGEVIECIQFFDRNSGRAHSLPTLQYYAQTAVSLLTNSRLGVIIFYFALSIITFATQNLFLYSIYLIDIVVRAASPRCSSRRSARSPRPSPPTAPSYR